MGRESNHTWSVQAPEWEPIRTAWLEESSNFIRREWQTKNSADYSQILESDIEAETPILWPPDAKNWLIGKDSDAGEDWGQEEKGMTEDEMVGWHHRLNGHGFGWTPGVGDGQGGLVCCSSWGHKESDTSERLNWTDWAVRYWASCCRYMEGVGGIALCFSGTSTLVSEIATYINNNNLKTRFKVREIWKYRLRRQSPNRTLLKRKKKRLESKKGLNLDSESIFPFLKSINGNYILVYGF